MRESIEPLTHSYARRRDTLFDRGQRVLAEVVDSLCPGGGFKAVVVARSIAHVVLLPFLSVDLDASEATMRASITDEVLGQALVQARDPELQRQAAGAGPPPGS